MPARTLFEAGQQTASSGRWAGAFAGMTPVLIIFLLEQQIARGLTVGAIKG